MKRILLALLVLFVIGCFSFPVLGEEEVVGEPVDESQVQGGGATVFKLNVSSYGQSVSGVNVAGTFNNWNASDSNYKMSKDGEGNFTLSANLSAGKHLYKYIINGQWVKNMQTIESSLVPTPAGYENDGYGGQNAFINVGQ